MVKKFCDKCGEEIPRAMVVIRLKIEEDGRTLLIADICEKCKAEYFRELRGVSK